MLTFNAVDPGAKGRRSGPVTDLQRALERLLPGALPRFGADGHLGSETWEWLQEAADYLRIDPLPPPRAGAVVYPDLVTAILTWGDEGESPEPTVTPDCSGLVCKPSGGFETFDMRLERVPSSPKIRMASATKAHVRKPSAIVGIVLHQTSVRFSVSSAQLRAAGGNRALALAKRALNIASHLTVFTEAPDKSHGPLIVPNAPLLWHVNHGNGCNPIAQGMEVDGLYAGIDGDMRTVFQQKTPTPHMESTLEVARAGLRWLVENSLAEGAQIQYLWAHRQSSAMRRSDPGEWLWRNVATWARDHLKLKWEPTRTWGDGYRLPAQWGVDGGDRY